MGKIRHQNSIDEADILLVLGHGKADRLCGYKVSVFRNLNLNNKLVMSGSCYSPVKLNTICIDRGAIAVYSHLHLNEGFYRLNPFLENLIKGKGIGQVQQELINTNLNFC